MKATIDFEANLYRQLKIEAARRGRTIRELVEEGVRYVLEQPSPPREEGDRGDPSWFGALRRYAGAAKGEHDMPAIRSSIARGRTPRQ